MNKCHTFDLCAWRTIKEFAGIYNVKNVNYKLLHMEVTNKFSLYIHGIFYRLGLNHRINPYYADVVSGSIRAIRKSLALGFKSRLFFERLVQAYAYSCPCCGGIPLTLTKRITHYYTDEHIDALKSRKYDSIILQKYKDDPDMFKWLEYCGFSLKLRGRNRRLVSNRMASGKYHVIDILR